MNKRVTVVFDGGVLRPDVPLDLAPNTRYLLPLTRFATTVTNLSGSIGLDR